MSKNNKKPLDALRGDKPEEAEISDVYLVYAGLQGNDEHEQYAHEGPLTLLAKRCEPFSLQPGLNVVSGEDYDRYKDHEPFSKRVEDRHIVVTDANLRGFDTVSARKQLAATTAQPAALQFLHGLEDKRSHVADHRTRRNPDIVATLERRLARALKRQQIQLGGLNMMARQRASALSKKATAAA